MIELAFWGGAGTVTGSRHLLQAGSQRVLVDCGLFQGLKELRQRNWDAPPLEPASIDAVLLTHAHIDHSGYLPRLVKLGFRGPVYCTQPTRDLAHVLLLDAAELQEEDAEFLNRKRLSKHQPALPLYDRRDAQRALDLLRPHPYGEWLDLAPEMRFRFRDAGHLLGSAMVDVVARDDGREVRLLFSGDLGRPGMPLVSDPEPPGAPDVVLVESTYGNRLHPPEAALEALRPVLEQMVQRKCILLVPAFAVGRAQQILYLAQQLIRSGALREFPIYIDSPMAVDATEIYARYPDFHGLTADELALESNLLYGRNVHLTRTVEQSKRINGVDGPALILSSSGMLSGGRVLHHLKRILPDPRHMIALVGYQAAGTRGRALQGGAATIRIHGEDIPVRAAVVDLGHLSGHADRDELLHWMASAERPPQRIFATHGEPDAALALVAALRATGRDAAAAELGQRIAL